ncbi:hypothetical protein BS78_08G108700 [Paspalum vaginatum]|nr:hypothetical protein BS78_08G108700 [Paspalum vaginatum]
MSLTRRAPSSAVRASRPVPRRESGCWLKTKAGMKVQCDMCMAEAPEAFCSADKAALCDACDRRVHRANKLTGKHRCFSLLSPAPSSSGSAQQ